MISLPYGTGIKKFTVENVEILSCRVEIRPGLRSYGIRIGFEMQNATMPNWNRLELTTNGQVHHEIVSFLERARFPVSNHSGLAPLFLKLQGPIS